MSLLTIFKGLIPKKPPTCTAVIAAAGISVRCEGEDKLLYEVNGKPVIAYSIEPFEKCRFVNEVIIVANENNYLKIGEICNKHRFKKVSHIIIGGPTRLDSVINGVFAASKKARLIAIHDGARPCLTPDILEETVKKAESCSAAAPAIAITSTVKKVIDEVIVETVDREGLYEIQTPQIFRAEIIKAALTNAKKKSIEITDDCMAAELIGANVYIVEGSRKNIKISDKKDLELVENFLSEDKSR